MIEIDELEGRELAEAVALSQGWARGFGGYLCGPFDAEGMREIFMCDYRPDRDIAQAWELDGEGWLWESSENMNGLVVRVLVPTISRWAYGAWVDWADFSTKPHATATARCRAFLKAMAAR